MTEAFNQGTKPEFQPDPFQLLTSLYNAYFKGRTRTPGTDLWLEVSQDFFDWYDSSLIKLRRYVNEIKPTPYRVLAFKAAKMKVADDLKGSFIRIYEKERQ